MDSNLSLYRIFAIVAETGSISAAAKKLYISQPAISKSISNLEMATETQLFERYSRGVKLTEAGELLYKYVSDAFESIKQAENALKKHKELGVGHISIGVSTTLCRYRLLPYLKPFVNDYPHISIDISCQSTNHTLELLQQKKLDIGLVARPKNTKLFNFISIGEIEDVFVATPHYLNHLLLRQSVSGLDILNASTLMLLDKGNASRQYIDYFLVENHIQATNTIEITTMDLLIELAKTGLGVACVIKAFVEEDLAQGTLCEIELDQKIHHREIGFAWLKQPSTNPSLQTLINFITHFSPN